MLKRYTTLLAATMLLCLGSLPQGVAALPRSSPQTSESADYEGKIVKSIRLPGVPGSDGVHLLRMLPQKEGEPLSRDLVRESMHTLFSTGRFSDIQAEVVPSGNGVILSFTTAPNFFVGAVQVQGAPNQPTHNQTVNLIRHLERLILQKAPSRPTPNQIVNASKFQLGELYTPEKLDRALENVRRLMQEDGYYQAHVTAESTSNLATQQVNVLLHITPYAQAHVGEVKVTGSSALSVEETEDIAHLHRGDRVTSDRVTGALQRLRKRFQKQSRALAQVSIAEQFYREETNTVDFTFQIDPGPSVVIYALGYHIGRRAMRREIPVYEENAVDDDLLNEGKRNLLDYMQNHGHFDAQVSFEKDSQPQVFRVIYRIDPGPMHKLVKVEITGNKEFLDTAQLRSYLQIQPASRFLSHGRYSGTLLKADVATLEALYRSNGFRQVKIETNVKDDYLGPNRLAVQIHIDEGPRTRVGEMHLTGNEKIPSTDLPELSTQPGQPYSEENLANDRERILTYYFNHGFPNASLDITTKASASEPNREDVTFDIQEGERFRVNRVMVAGTENTRAYIVDRQLQVRPEEPLSQQELLDTQTRLYNLGIFSQVDTAVQNPEGTDPLKNVLVQLQEAQRYTFTYGVGLEFETGLPAGAQSPEGATGVSPRVGFNVTRLNIFGRDQTLSFQSHVGRLEQRGLVSYTFPELFNNEKFKLINTVFYDNSLDVATFTSQRLEGKIDVRQQIGSLGNEGTRPGPSTLSYRFDFRTVKASHFAPDFSQGEIQIFSLPARVGGPGFTYIFDKRDNPLESTQGTYFTLDAFAATGFFGSRSDTQKGSLATNFSRALEQYSTYYAFGRGTAEHKYVFARSTSIGIVQPFNGTHVLPPGECSLNSAQLLCSNKATIPLPEQFFAGGGNSHRGFGLNQAGPRDPSSGFPIGGTALFVNNLELRFPQTSLPYLGEGFGFAVFHDMGNVYTAPHDMLKGFLRWHQADPGLCLADGTTNSQCVTQFNNSGYDYTSHAVGLGVLYRTPLGPLRFDFAYNLNPTQYFQNRPGAREFTLGTPSAVTVPETQRLPHFNVFFSIGQPF